MESGMSIDLEWLQVSAPVRLSREVVTFHPLHGAIRNGSSGGCSRSLRE